jgi:hypothetical protein
LLATLLFPKGNSCLSERVCGKGSGVGVGRTVIVGTAGTGTVVAARVVLIAGEFVVQPAIAMNSTSTPARIMSGRIFVVGQSRSGILVFQLPLISHDVFSRYGVWARIRIQTIQAQKLLKMLVLISSPGRRREPPPSFASICFTRVSRWPDPDPAAQS